MGGQMTPEEHSMLTQGGSKPSEQFTFRHDVKGPVDNPYYVISIEPRKCFKSEREASIAAQTIMSTLKRTIDEQGLFKDSML